MGIRMLSRRTGSVRAFAADASTIRVPGSSPVTAHLVPRTDRARHFWAGWKKRRWLHHPLRTGQRDPVRPPARPPA
ncbi:hypothetical protein OG787_37455 [Streptomyces sp. NBC_00075]|uniref:Transposase IS701-like DDE domain-containing protein n=1 Tax=Streptomyces sp. NBC_00093 TaxID=2975649 RepID=A0AAU2A7V8_9ACTN